MIATLLIIIDYVLNVLWKSFQFGPSYSYRVRSNFCETKFSQIGEKGYIRDFIFAVAQGFHKNIAYVDLARQCCVAI